MRVVLVALTSVALAVLPVLSPARDGVPATVHAQSPDQVVSQAGSVHSTYRSLFGGDGNDQAAAVAVGQDGTVYLAGFTTSPGFPYAGAAPQGSAAFVAGVDVQGQLQFGTLLDGSADEGALGLTMGPDGSLYVVGWTASPDFPTTPGAFDTSFNGGTQPDYPHSDAFVARLSADTGDLLYSTFLGGSGTSHRADELATGVAVDGEGHAYVVGGTDSTDFPVTPGAFSTEYGGGQGDGFIAKLSPDGSTLIYSTFLGGTQATDDFSKEHVNRVVVDGSGTVYTVGRTNAADFPGTEASPPGGSDFVAALSPDGTSLLHSALVSGARDLASSPDGTLLVAGETDAGDAAGLWIRRFSGDWSAPEPLFYLAGTGAESLSALTPSAEGLYLAGVCGATDLPDIDAGEFSGQRPFLIRLSADGSNLLQAAILGMGTERITGLACGGGGHVGLAGYADDDYETLGFQVLMMGIDANLPPVAADDEVKLVGITSTPFYPLANDADPDGDSLVITAVTAPEWGTVEVEPDGLSLTYHPGTGRATRDSFTYTVSDGRGEAAEATVTVLVPDVSGVQVTGMVYLPLVPLRP